MTYKKAKKIFPGNWSIPLNGWYQNVDLNGSPSSTEGSKGGPTSVLAVPGWRYFQTFGYAIVSDVVADAASAAKSFEIIVPSPYKNDDTRQDLNGLNVAASSDEPAYIYRVSLSIGDDWLGDGEQAGSRKTATVHIPSGERLSLGIDNSGSPTSNAGRQAAYAEIAVGSGVALATPIAEGTGANGSIPLIYETPSGIVNTAQSFVRVTADTKFKVYVKAAATGTSVSSNGGATITAEDKAAGRRGYILCEVCYMRPDTPVAFTDLDPYIAYPIHSPGS
jgi:hypothetical protein